MFTVCKKIEVAGSHCLSLPYTSKCNHQHGHNWVIKVWCRSETLNENGMVIDFSHIKDFVNQLDHENIDDVLLNVMKDFEGNSTAEKIAQWICNGVEHCFKVEVWESEDNLAIFEK